MLVAGLNRGNSPNPEVSEEAEFNDGDTFLGHILKHDCLDCGGHGKQVHEKYRLALAVLHYLLTLQLALSFFFLFYYLAFSVRGQGAVALPQVVDLQLLDRSRLDLC